MTVNFNSKSLQTQQVFRKLVEDSIIKYSVKTWIFNMRKAIDDTNVVLSLAISPGLLLLPSEMIILKEKIPGYNNTIKIANNDMSFGVNKNINFNPIKDNFNEIKTVSTDTLKAKPDNHNSNLAIILVLSTASSYIFSKYLL